MTEATGTPNGLAWIGGEISASGLALWLLDGANKVLDRRTLRLDALSLTDEGLAALLADLPGVADEGLPTVICGAGRDLAPTRAVPCAPLGPPQSRGHLHLLPGLHQASSADLMRGVETAIAGLIAAQPQFDGVVCLPGPATVWAQVSAEEVVSFRSFLTGDLFALLAGSNALQFHVAPDGWDDAAFDTALDETLSRPASLSAVLAGLPAEAEITGLSKTEARARLAGLLIGAELAGAKPWWLGQNVAVLGDDALIRPYLRALHAQGVPAHGGDRGAATLAGLCAAKVRLTGQTQ